MNDPAATATDEIIAEIEKKIAKEYRKAHKEVAAKLDDYLARFAKKDEIWQKWVASGKKKEEDYKKWKTGQILVGARWADVKQNMADDYANAAKIAASIANGYKPEVYAVNHNYATYQVETGSQINTNYSLYSRETVERMYRDNHRLYHTPGKEISQQIKEGKLKNWDKRRIQSVLMQGIIQGESIPNLTKRLKAVTAGDHKAAIRNARTMMTGVQNGGRIDAIDRANNLGIETRKQWMATLDMRTRHWHRQLDGVVVDNDKPFEHSVPGVTGVAKIMFPGDPTAHPADLYNCRCTLIAAVKGQEMDLSDTSLRYDANLNGMSYDEWKAEKTSTSHPITKQEATGEAMKQHYINEYAGGHGVSGGRHQYTAEDGQRIMDEWWRDQAEAGRETTQQTAYAVVNGRDITQTWKRRPDEFDFEIEDVINAQGFDGLPRVVSRQEFDDAVKAANDGAGFIAQRTYSAPDQETLDAYRDQLYHGKWYVDCSTGGAQYGQGMYCAADYSGNLTAGIRTEMQHYYDQYLGTLGYDLSENEWLQKASPLLDKYGVEKSKFNEIARAYIDENDQLFEKLTSNLSDSKRDDLYEELYSKAKTRAVHNYVETFTLDPSAKVVTWREINDIRMGNLDISYRTAAIEKLVDDSGLTADEATFVKYNLGTGITWREVDAAAKRLTPERRGELVDKFYNIGEEATRIYNDEHERRIAQAHVYQENYRDIGSLAAALGYDAINAEGHGQSGSYTVILNRTKVIILGE